MKHTPIDLPLRVELLIVLVATALAAILTYVGSGIFSAAISAAVENLGSVISGSTAAHFSAAPLFDAAYPFLWAVLAIRMYLWLRRVVLRWFRSAMA